MTATHVFVTHVDIMICGNRKVVNDVHNIIWIQDNGSIRECAMCENYTDEPHTIMDVCLGCRHEYLAHTDDDANEMDYPKPDLFKMKGGAE